MSRPTLKACYYLIGLFCFCFQSISAQDQRVADSLAIIYSTDEAEGVEKLELLKNLSFNEKENRILGMQYTEELIRLSKLWNNQKYLYSGYLQKGFKHNFLGESEEALAAFYKCAEIALEANDISKEGTAYSAIADVYSTLDNFENSEKYYAKAINLLRISQDSIYLASALLNAGDTYFNNQKYDEAINYFEESGQIYNDINYEIGKAYNLGNVGMVYAEQGNDALAEQKINEALIILEKIKDYYPISVYLTYMSDIYLRKNNWTKARNYAQRSLDLAQKYGLKEQISDANLKLFELNQQKGNFEKSIDYLQNYYTYRDSILNIETVEKMADLRTNYEVSQKQAEIDLKDAEVDLLNEKQRSQRVTIIAAVLGLGLLMILALGLFRRNRFVQKTSNLIQKERDRSDQLLLNILPEETAKELKDKGKVKAKKFESVSVLFTDFEGFTQYSANLSPEELVESVNYYYSKFDEIMEKYGLEKIKTIGDAYMAAGGLPFPSDDHALKLVQAAFEIVEFVKESKKVDPYNMTRFAIRIGIHTGPVVAGVVGTKKFAYDIWGDTVNIASRLESNSEPGKINISDSTFQLVKDQYKCTYRGEIEAKNKGMMKMYFVEGKALDQASKVAI